MSEKAERTPERKEHPTWVSSSEVHDDFCCYAPSVSSVCFLSWCVSYGYLWKENYFLDLFAPFRPHFGATNRIHDLNQIVVFDLRLHQNRRVFLLRILGFQTKEHFGQLLKIVFIVYFGNRGLHGRPVGNFQSCLADNHLDSKIRLVGSRTAGAGRDTQFHDRDTRKDGSDEQKDHQNGKNIHHRCQVQELHDVRIEFFLSPFVTSGHNQLLANSRLVKVDIALSAFTDAISRLFT